MSSKQITSLIVVGILAVIFIGALGSTFERNDAQNWQIWQHVSGKITVVSSPGWYLKWFGKVWTYPKYIEATYNDEESDGRKERESVRATFNDGGTAQISTYVKFQTPLTAETRIKFHELFAGDVENAINSVKAHSINCIKAAAPIMSSSENQAARKAEFALIIERMLKDGLYEMRRVDRVLKDRFDQKGNPLTVQGTEIINDDKGIPIVSQMSPLKKYSIEILQFSVTDVDYDPETRKQFAAKKESFLAAEKSKAQREQEVQQRLMVIERGLREKAEATAKANVLKAKAVIAAEQKAEVALQTKIEAETKASQFLAVAGIEKAEALMKASKMFEVAEILAKAALEDKKAMIAQAEGKQKAIELSGAITELEQQLINAEVVKVEKASQYLSQINVPKVVIMGQGGTNSDGAAKGNMSLTGSLINLALMERLGLINSVSVSESALDAKRQEIRTKTSTQ